jgi:hypothetical protein
MYGQNPYSQYPYTGYAYPNYGNRQFMQPQQQMVQPQMQQQIQQQLMQYETPIQDIRFVTSEEAKAFIVMPNSNALLIDKKGGVAHLKTADNMGQSVTQYFKFEQVNADGTPLKPQENEPKIDYGMFLTKEELQKYGFVKQDQLNAILDKLEIMQKQIKGVRENGNATNTTKGN